MLASVVVIGFCSFQLQQTNEGYQEARQEYDKVKKSVLKDTPSDTTNQTETEERTAEDTIEKEIVQEDTSAVPSVDFDELKAINADVVGWLYIPEQEGAWSEISYPVLHGDTNDQYLHTTISAAGNYAGSLFTDERNKDSFEEFHTIIYGHSMKDGSMFGQLKFMRSSQNINNPKFWIITEDGVYEYDIFCIREVSAYDDQAYMTFGSFSDSYAEFIQYEYMQSEKSFKEPMVGIDNRTVTLSTCVGTGEEGERLVVRGILTDSGEQ